MDEGNVGKDLALEEREEFEKQILEAIKNLKAGETTISEEGIEVTNYGGQATIKLKGITFGIIDKEGNFTYNKENFVQIKKALEEEGLTLEELGLPDIEEWIDEEEEQKQDEQKGEEVKEENEKDEKDLSEEKAEEEKNNETEEIAKKYNVDSSRVRHLSLTRRIAGEEALPELDSKTKGYKDIYIIPGKDEYSSIMLGVDKEGKEEELELNRSKGKVPDINIKLITEDEIYDEVKPYEYHEIDSRQGIAKIKDSVGKDVWIYCRQEEGRGKEFQGVIIPEEDTKNIDSNPTEVRDAMDYRQNSAKDLADRADAIEKQKEYEELGAPSAGGEGVQLEETEHPEKNIKAIKEELMQRDGISLSEALKRNAMPGYYEKVDADYQRKAEQVYKLVTVDKMPYEEAVKKVKENDREKGGNTPDQNPRKRNQ